MNSHGRRLDRWCCAVPLLLAALSSAAGAEDSEVRFNRDVRPILSNRCFACHGPDQNTRKADLRLDQREAAVVVAIVPGDAKNSPLLARITSEDPDEAMPPARSNKPRLTADEVEILRRWIDSGAAWEGHWAYAQPERAPVPELDDPARARNPIDAFIQWRLEREGMRTAEEADRRTLLRRLSFDLTGLPPRLEDVAAFENDAAPDAYERWVDRLLSSPHFGERMAANWLDLVRYADTDGFHADNYRNVWPYRDYVIRAFNENVPFDQFTVEQVAGDLLPSPARWEKIASTYNRLNRTTEEGGAQAKEYLAKYAADRVRTTATVWMASTMGCAECHDHKFDPFTARDFYSFASFFADVKEVGVGKPEEIPVPDGLQQGRLDEFDGEITALKKVLDTTTPEVAAGQARWEEKLLAEHAAGRLGWEPVQPRKLESKNGTTLNIEEGWSVLATGKNPDKEAFTLLFQTDREQITSVRLEALTDPMFDKGRLSRGGGNFILSEFEVEVRASGATAFRPVKLKSARADFEQSGFPVSAAIDGKADTGWAVDGHKESEDRRAVFEFEQPIGGGAGTELIVRLRHEANQKRHVIGRFRVSVISIESPAVADDGLPPDAYAGLVRPKSTRTLEEAEAVAKFYRSIALELDPVRAEMAAVEGARKEYFGTLPRSLVTVTTEPRETRVLPRGNWMDDSGPVVEPAVPAFLGKIGEAEARLGRMELARWLVSKENPLTARVFVNRLWRIFFGTGIVRTLDDFGAQGEWPRHPELLDWLASEFVESGWDIKGAVKQIVMSHTYRQSSRPSQTARAKDPANRLLSHQSSFRLPAEFIRDNALSIAGMLSEGIGGPSVKPYQPDGYWAQLNFPKRTYQADAGRDQYRRGLYTFWCRTFTHPSFVTFDAPSREECAVERVPSNTPLQALVLLNDPTYVEAARVFAERLCQTAAGSDRERVVQAFQRALHRSPSAQEERALLDLLANELERYRADARSAESLLAVGQWQKPGSADGPELAAWTAVARVLFNLHETMVRY